MRGVWRGICGSMSQCTQTECLVYVSKSRCATWRRSHSVTFTLALRTLLLDLDTTQAGRRAMHAQTVARRGTAAENEAGGRAPVPWTPTTDSQRPQLRLVAGIFIFSIWRDGYCALQLR